MSSLTCAKKQQQALKLFLEESSCSFALARMKTATMADKTEVTSLTILRNAATYPLWSFQIKILFQAKDLMKYVDGTVPVDMVPEHQSPSLERRRR